MVLISIITSTTQRFYLSSFNASHGAQMPCLFTVWLMVGVISIFHLHTNITCVHFVVDCRRTIFFLLARILFFISFYFYTMWDIGIEFVQYGERGKSCVVCVFFLLPVFLSVCPSVSSSSLLQVSLAVGVFLGVLGDAEAPINLVS